jgi:hypothetical protein
MLLCGEGRGVNRACAALEWNLYINIARVALRRTFGVNCCWPLQHSQFWFRVLSGPMSIILLFSGLLHVLTWGLLFSDRRGLTTNGHPHSTGGESSRHTLTGPLLQEI